MRGEDCRDPVAAVNCPLARAGPSRAYVDVRPWDGGAGTGALPADLHYAETHDIYSVSRYVRAALGLRGPAHVVSTACSSSAKVFAAAARMVDLGVVDAAVVGGVDSLCMTTLFHPKISGKPGRIGILEGFLEHMHSHPDVWFATCNDVANFWLKEHRHD